MNNYREDTHEDTKLDAGELISLWDDLLPTELLSQLHAHPFLTACRQGAIDVATLRRFLVQQHYYSQYFTRYLCGMMSSLTENADVRALAQNLFEEMGLNEQGAVTHAELYQQCMRAAGTQPQVEPIQPQTRALIEAMFHYCRSGDPLEGLSALCLGAEAIVPTIYGGVLSAMQHLDVSAEGRLFFVLHVEEDEGHAIVMRKVIDRMLRVHPHRRSKVIAIGEDMIRLRMDMLDGIFQEGGSHGGRR